MKRDRNNERNFKANGANSKNSRFYLIGMREGKKQCLINWMKFSIQKIYG